MNDEFKADIEYLTEAEWRSEMEHLLGDLRDTPDGRVKHHRDIVEEEAIVAWNKVSLSSFDVGLSVIFTTHAVIGCVPLR